MVEALKEEAKYWRVEPSWHVIPRLYAVSGILKVLAGELE